MTDKPSRPSGVAKPRKTPKPKAVPYTPIVPGPKEKDMLSPAGQELLHNLFQSCTPEQQAALTVWMNTLIVPPIFNEGYKKVMRWWRSYGKLHPNPDISL